MVEMKLINSHCFTAANTFRLAAAIAVLALCLAAAHGENLTTLDGKTYTNITDISKYPKQVVFTSNSNRVGVAITNLPEDFRAKYGIKKPTPIAVAKTTPEIVIQTNKLSDPLPPKNVKLTPELDDYLAKHADSNLFVEQIDNQNNCTIDLRAKGFELEADNFEFYIPSVGANACVVKAAFEHGQETSLDLVFKKFFEWDSIASKSNAEQFHKEISQKVGDHVFVFTWSGESKTSRLFFDTNKNVGLCKNHVMALEKMLADLPELKQQLVKKIETQESQNGLFK